MRQIYVKLFHFIFRPIISLFDKNTRKKNEQLNSINQILQQNLVSGYKNELILKAPPRKLHKIGFKKYSQNNEDGILLYLFSRIGTVNRNSVEIGCGYGKECNTANLILNHNWRGLLIDASKKKTEFARKFYQKNKSDAHIDPIIVQEHITKGNVNDVLDDNDFEGEIDLLSIDIDGVDYWIWKAINKISPRVVVTEVQCIWGSQKSVTVPYSDNFEAGFKDGYGIYSGASLAAFEKLASEKGYRFIGIEYKGYNAFFVRNDISEELVPEEELSVIDSLPFVKWAKSEFLTTIREKEWEDV